MKKTIFKRPLFVNPQAYTVIPELYSIDKLLSFNFDENDTYTTKLVYNGRIESIIKKAGEEYILHLDLYTVDGSCVLGEWYVKGIDSESVVTIDKSILTIVANNNLKYPGLIAAWSAKGKTNEDVDRNILKDLTGNRHDITLNNFAYSEMSGYGGYSFSFKQFNSYYHSTKVTREITEDIGADRYLVVNTNLGFTAPEFRIKYKVVGNSSLKYTYTDENGSRRDLLIVKQNSGGGSGEITIPQCYSSVIEVNGFTYNAHSGNITIELLPEYPDALVFDGVDDYGSNVDFGDTKYVQTVIIKYLALTASPSSSYSYIRGVESSGHFRMNHNAIDKEPFIRVAVIPNKFYIKKDTDNFMQSAWDDNKHSPYSINGYANGKEIGKMVFYSAYLFDRSLDEQEIKSFIRKYIDSEYLLPSEQYLVLNLGKLNIDKLK